MFQERFAQLDPVWSPSKAGEMRQRGPLARIRFVLVSDFGNRPVIGQGPARHLGIERRRLVAALYSAQSICPFKAGHYPRTSQQPLHIRRAPRIKLDSVFRRVGPAHGE